MKKKERNEKVKIVNNEKGHGKEKLKKIDPFLPLTPKGGRSDGVLWLAQSLSMLSSL